MTATPPPEPPAGAGPGPDLSRPDDTLRAVGAVALRLLAGAVQKRTMEQLQRTVQENPSEYPWQVVVRTVLAEPVDDQKLVQQGLQAQRDWILRGGRERPAPPVGQRAKGLLARLVAQLIVCAIGTLLVIGALLLVKYRWPEWDIYRVLGWIQDLAQRLR